MLGLKYVLDIEYRLCRQISDWDLERSLEQVNIKDLSTYEP